MSSKKSKTTSHSGGAKQTYVQPNDTTTRSQRTNTQRVQNALVIWLDNTIDNKNHDRHNTITQLRRVVNDVNIFTDVDECFQFIKNLTDRKVCMITSGSLGQNIMPHIHNMSQVDSIFIFCSDTEYHKRWAKHWQKIRDVLADISPICDALKQAVRRCEQNAISISFVATGGDSSKKKFDKLDPMLMYSRILKEILLTIKFDDGHIKEFLDHCRSVFAGNDKELKNMARLQKKYRKHTPIWWYTRESFLYPMLNSALQVMNMDIIIKMGFFVGDLHRHIEQLHSEQFTSTNSRQVLTVFRGQGMSRTNFEQMTKTQGGLLSFNNFLSTSRDPKISLSFAQQALPNMDMIGILFVMTVDPTKSTTPFASVVGVGYFDEEDEILFSMHTVFRIGEIKPMDKKHRLFEVQLTLTSDKDNDLCLLVDQIRAETNPNDKGWYRLGLWLRKVGESARAQQVYEILLEQTTDTDEKGTIFGQLGLTKCDQGEYNEAITYYKKALDILKRTLPPTDLNLACCYNNIGSVYKNMGDYPKALSFHEKALEIHQQSLPYDHPDLGNSYNNVGLVYKHMGDYPKALSSHEKALEIHKQSLPSNHPNLSASYSNIGILYNNMGEYSKALSSYEKALKIQQKSLPSNHVDFGVSYNNIGNVHYNIGDYQEARSYYERAVEIGQHSLSPKHPNLQSWKKNLDMAKKKM